MEYRLFQPGDDLRQISRIYAQSWKSAYRGIVPQDYLDALPEDRWVKPLSQNPDHIWLGLDAALPVGTSTVGPARDKAMAGWGELVSIYLLPEYQGKGIGTALFQKAVHSLQNCGYTNLYLWVLEENHAARRFYEKMGWKPNGDRLSATIGGKELIEIRYIFTIS